MAFNYLDNVLPGDVSGSNLVCLYQFDGPTLGLTDRSGNGHDLTETGAALWTRSSQGEGLWQNRTNRWLSTDAKSGVFNTLGAFTVEWIEMKLLYAEATEILWVIGELGSAVESLNVTGCFYTRSNASDPQSMIALHEEGAGVNVYAFFEWGQPFGGLHHGALTRAADGVTYKYYSDGNLLETVVASDPPTGGTGSIKIYLQGSGSTSQEHYGYMNSWRYCRNVEFSPTQILSSYNRVHV
jgi:hypothetical protein